MFTVSPPRPSLMTALSPALGASGSGAMVGAGDGCVGEGVALGMTVGTALGWTGVGGLGEGPGVLGAGVAGAGVAVAEGVGTGAAGASGTGVTKIRGMDRTSATNITETINKAFI